MTVTLSNSGNASLSFTSNPTVTGTNAADFAITSASCSTASPVAAGASCTVTLTFTPSIAGAESASLVFADNAGMQSVPLTGTGSAMTPAKVLLVTATVAFGLVPQGATSAPMTAVLMNVGGSPLNFSSNPTITGANAADFVITTSSCSTAAPVPASQTCTVTLTFTPATLGAETASLNFADNAAPATQTIMLTGTGTAKAPEVSVMPASLVFTSVAVGTTSAPMTVTLTNTGSASLTFTVNPAITGPNAADFAITASSTCSSLSAVAVGASCTVSVTVKPSTASAETAFLNFVDNAASSPQSVPLTATGTTPLPGTNVVPLTVDRGPAGNSLNILFASITICVPGTTNCQTIDHVQVDTGSSGLRLLASQVTIPIPRANDAGGNPLANCAMFADLSFAWGPMATADIQMKDMNGMIGEAAFSQAVQLINAPGFPVAPTACSNGSIMNITNQATLGANGLLGVGEFRQDCGPACAGPAATAPAVYFSCPANNCAVTSLPLLSQLQNPIWRFSQDNNGVLITLPTVPAIGQATITTGASMIFGIGTQANNALGSAKVYTTDPNFGDFTVTFNGSAFPGSFVDSGSNGFFFLDTAQTSLVHCTTATGFYCPPSTASFTVANTGANGATGQVMFNIANTESLLAANPTFSAFSNIGGPFPGAFDYGLPFFYGRSVFTGIEGQQAGAFTGPFFAF